MTSLRYLWQIFVVGSIQGTMLAYSRCSFTCGHSDKHIDIKRKNRLLKVCYVPATSTTFLAFFLFFLLWPLTVLMKQTRQAVCIVKQSILLRCLWTELTFKTRQVELVINQSIRLDVYGSDWFPLSASQAKNLEQGQGIEGVWRLYKNLWRQI